MPKAQIMLTDLILAVSIFIVIGTVAFLSFDTYKSEIENTDTNNLLQVKATVFSDILIRNPDIGIVIEPNVLSIDKLDDFSKMDYNATKVNFALGYYDFYIQVYYTNGTIIKEMGQKPSGNYISYSLQRILVESSRTAFMEMIIWQKA